MILGVSVSALAIFVWSLFYGNRISQHIGNFFKRVVSAYLVTFAVALLLLFLFDKALWINSRLHSPAVSWSRFRRPSPLLRLTL